ncbi:WPP domain-interacting tail-anchored protein 2 [Malania oleifera]|uniref:WPP domain-interacting tail-anchored protein 2 n=1 Tax=Malania oleifera TaxID=397392 RepID=UPI0025AD9DD7|nr:WPP domain-interacting tail-anchored protein 2 [Malania oleifera]XP_057962655.1 WPP domain-interacting tail-anchored protein 2 [Malania oleifera]XP_057962656.1 WPP domain-interacting tail-anchored protein 2 [Malania oleifera]XP_057962657.1 WPP domain-interacting tail-anchored protein 2 [Malania oleifera]
MGDSAVDDMDATDPEADKIYIHEGVSPHGKGIQETQNMMEVLMRLDLELAYSSEKLVNLDMLLLHMLASKEDDGPMTMEYNYVLGHSVEVALAFDLLSGIIDSEVRELGNFVDSLQTEIVDACQKMSSCEHLRELVCVVKEKLHDSEEYLKLCQEKVLEMKMQSDNMQRALLASQHENWENDMSTEYSENGQFPEGNAKSKMQMVKQQRYILRMLEKSIARELNLEKRISELKQNEEELGKKLHLTEQVAFGMEEAAKVVWGRFLEAENAAEVLMGISKELMCRLQIVQFNLNGSTQREGELNSRLQDCIEQLKAREAALLHLATSNEEPTANSKDSLNEAEDNCIIDKTELFTLREKVKLLEEQLKETRVQLKSADASKNLYLEQLNEAENIMETLKESISKAERRAETAEARVSVLTETNLELTEELGFLKGSDSNAEKVTLLEKKLRELEIQLQHAKASFEASQEQQNMLYSAIWDMEMLIADLKSKASKAETKTEIAEEQSVILSENNLELNKEVKFLKDRVEFLEKSLCETNDVKVACAKEIHARTKLMMDMVTQLTVERVRMQSQLHSIMKERKNLAENLCETRKDASVIIHENVDDNNKGFLFPKEDSTIADCTITSKEAVAESSSKVQVDNQAEEGSSVSAKNADGVVSKLEAVTMEDGRQHNLIYVFKATFVLLISILVTYLFTKKAELFNVF